MPKLTLEGALTVTEIEYEDTIVSVGGEPLASFVEDNLPVVKWPKREVGGVWTTNYGRARVTIETLEDPQDA